MLTPVERWLTANPLWHDALFLVLSIILAPFITHVWSTFTKFVKIPPQRLNIWILQARISSTDSSLQRLHRLRNDQSYLIVECLDDLSSALFAILALILSVIALSRQQLALHDPHTLFPLRWLHFAIPVIRGFSFVILLGFVLAFLDFRGIVTSIRHPHRKEQRLKANLERLTTKLLLRGYKRYYGADSDAA
jgi:hypothetical protein